MRSSTLVVVLVSLLLVGWLATGRGGPADEAIDAASSLVDDGGTSALELVAGSTSGAPVPVLRLRLEPIRTEAHAVARELELRAEDGRYRVEGLAPGWWSLTVVDGLWRTVEPIGRLELRLPAREPLAVTAVAPGSLTVVALDALGRGLPGVEVEALCPGVVIDPQRTDDAGVAHLAAVPVGQVRVRLGHGSTLVRQSAEVESAVDRLLRVQLPGGAVRGLVHDQAGFTVPGVEVGLRRVLGAGAKDRGPWLLEAITGDDGYFSAPLLGPGTYEVAVLERDAESGQARRARGEASKLAEVGLGRVVEVALEYSRTRTVAVTGALLAGLEPVPLAGLTFVRSPGAATRTARTDARGRFAVELPEGGAWAILAKLAGRSAIELERVTVTAGAVLERDLALPTGSLEGRLVDTSGQGLEGVTMEVVPGGGWRPWTQPLEPRLTESDGSFAFHGLLAGPWTVHASPRDGALARARSQSIEVSAGDRQGHLELVSTPAGSLRLHIASDALDTGAAVVVHVRDATGARVLARPVPRGETLAEGVLVAGLPPGSYRAMATDAVRASAWSEAVQVTSGVEVGTEVELVPGGWIVATTVGAAPEALELTLLDPRGIDVTSMAPIAQETAGRYRLGPLFPGTYVLNGRSVDESRGRVEVTVVGGADALVWLELR